MFGLNYQAGLHRGERGLQQLRIRKWELQISCQQQASSTFGPNIERAALLNETKNVWAES